ncbi:hypothetical protein BKA69DRAFT_1163040 [Paraphysoderma sedebokerense]|nr:hypothetical protein BKA69DRAFT_1163040 [Paraphysoderma sedebokerense]
MFYVIRNPYQAESYSRPRSSCRYSDISSIIRRQQELERQRQYEEYLRAQELERQRQYEEYLRQKELERQRRLYEDYLIQQQMEEEAYRRAVYEKELRRRSLPYGRRTLFTPFHDAFSYEDADVLVDPPEYESIHIPSLNSTHCPTHRRKTRGRKRRSLQSKDSSNPSSCKTSSPVTIPIQSTVSQPASPQSNTLDESSVETESFIDTKSKLSEESAAVTLQNNYRIHLSRRLRSHFSHSLSQLSSLRDRLNQINTNVPSILTAPAARDANGKFIVGLENKELLAMEEELLSVLVECDKIGTGSSFFHLLRRNHNGLDSSDSEAEQPEWWEDVAKRIRRERRGIVREAQKVLNQLDEKKNNVNSEVEVDQDCSSDDDGWLWLAKVRLD